MNIRRPPSLTGTDSQKLEQLKAYVNMLIEDIELWANQIEKKQKLLERKVDDENKEKSS